MRETLIIGAGHNALVTAFYLARAGRRPLVLERRPIVGGCAITEALAPGYRSATLAHAIGPIRSDIVRDMDLERRGVRFVAPDPALTALALDGPPLALSRDVTRTVAAIRAISPKDADRYPGFVATLQRAAHFVGELLDAAPPALDGATAAELWQLLKTGRRFRALGKKTSFTLLRWGQMAVADLVGESFEHDRLQAAIAARGIFGTAMGPWSAGTGALLLLGAAVDRVPGGSSITVAGGPGALTKAMADAAREAGAEIRTSAGVQRILVKNEAVAGVLLDDGSELPAESVVSGADPRRTFLQLVDPNDLNPTFSGRIRNYRSTGTVAKLNIALGGVPAFRGLDTNAAPAGRLQIGPGIDYLERAFDASKYGEISAAPYLDIAFPSAADASMAPAGRHVMSVHMQYAPYRLRDRRSWDLSRDDLREIVFRTLEEYAPGFTSLVEHCQVITPLDLEREYGLTGGHIFHGELALDQLFVVRPTLGWARYATPIRGLFLCGSGTHPGNGLTGASGRNAAHAILRHPA
ncbi:MAG: phytoene desaturase family protein [Vicinamibacterales bacterium]